LRDDAFLTRESGRLRENEFDGTNVPLWEGFRYVSCYFNCRDVPQIRVEPEGIHVGASPAW
jgi:hypothetical protein